MNLNEIKRAWKAEPFKPFRINLADGRSFEVNHPEFLAVFPGFERTVILALPDEQAVEHIDLLLVTSLTIRENGRAKGDGKKKSA